MKVYSLGNKAGPTLMLLPGTCCHWKSNFAPVLPLLEPHFHVLCVSYDGFDETEPDTTFPTMEEEAAKIEAYINENLGGHLHAAYGCSLGGSFVGLLAARQNIRLEIGILGSSDLDQASPFVAKLETDIALPLIYPVVRDGRFKSKLLNKRWRSASRKCRAMWTSSWRSWAVLGLMSRCRAAKTSFTRT